MRRATAVFATAVIALIVTGGSSALGGASKTVDVDDDFFEPASLTIKEDTTLKFNWVGINDHNIQWEAGPGPYFQSENHDEPGINYKRRFKKPGNYILGCFIHPDMNLALKVKRRRN